MRFGIGEKNGDVNVLKALLCTLKYNGYPISTLSLDIQKAAKHFFYHLWGPGRGREVAQGQDFEGEVEVTYFSICEVTQNSPKICEVNTNTRSRSFGQYLRGHA